MPDSWWLARLKFRAINKGISIPTQSLMSIHKQEAPENSSASKSLEEFHAIEDLVKRFSSSTNRKYIEEMIGTALRIGRDNLPEADLKLFNRSLKEMHQGARLFKKFSQRRKIAIFGSARTPLDAPEAQAAIDFARKIRKAGFMVITGGGDGIMGAAQLGAGREESFGLNIRLPFEQRPNPVIEGDSKLITFNYFFTRKLNFVKETHALALFPGGFGTMDEAFECLTLMQTGKARLMPVVLLDRPGGTFWKSMMHFITEHMLRLKMISPEDLAMFKVFATTDEAVNEITGFYKTYHSARYAGKNLVIRLNQPLAPSALASLEKEFADILEEGGLVQGKALDVEANEPEIAHLPRLILTPDRRNFGRLRQMIDAINRCPFEIAPAGASLYG